MTRAFDPVIKELRETLLLMGGRAEAILAKALRALDAGDADLAAEVAQDDVEIDRLDVELDDAVLRALALQAPVAADLREVVAIKMIATDLERVGDLARNIAKSALRQSERSVTLRSEHLPELAQQVRRMLRDALIAFSDADPDRARRILRADDEVDETQDVVIRAELAGISANPDAASESVDAIFVAKNLERVGDHATNIAEDVILMAEARNVKHAEKLV